MTKNWSDKTVRVVVPIIVLDELDGLKNRAPTAFGKWRAGYTLGVMGKAFASQTAPNVLHP
jgi:hypothetical protein